MCTAVKVAEESLGGLVRLSEEFKQATCMFSRFLNGLTGSVLILDDDKSVLRAVKTCLGDAGDVWKLDVVVTDSVDKARKLLSKKNIRIAIVDYWLGYRDDKNGTSEEICLELRKHNIPVIMMSGLVDRAITDFCKDNDIELVQKPFNSREMYKRISRSLVAHIEEEFDEPEDDE